MPVNEWYDTATLQFKLPEVTDWTEPFSLTKFIPKKKYDYVLDFFHDYEDLINSYNVVILFSKKDMGKSFIGYLWAREFFKLNIGNMIYGRLQELEKKNAKNELFRVFTLLNMTPFFDRKLGKDYINFENSDYTCRLVNLSSYQSLRGAIGDHVGFMWFDEINAYNFPPYFEADFINIISTLGRGNNFKLFMSGNNETATNNPVLNALQLKFNWNYNGVQLATREVNGVKILGVQLGAGAFNKTHVSLAEKLAQFNEQVYNTFYLGLSNTNACNKIVNLREDYKIKKTLFYWAELENIYSFNEGEVKDDENGLVNRKCIIVKTEPWNYESNKINKQLPMYTTSSTSNLRFKSSIYLDLPTAGNLILPYYMKLKNNQLYFVDFDSNDLFINKLLPAYYNKAVNNKEYVYDAEIKYK